MKYKNSKLFLNNSCFVSRMILIALFLSAFLKISVSNPVFETNLELKLLADSLNSGSNIYFEYGKYTIKKDAYDVLKLLADKMLANQNCKLIVTGYTDDISSDKFNLELSLKRANAVKNFLVNSGILPDRIFVEGKGKTEPVNSNSNETERALNRRVYFELTGLEKNIGKSVNNKISGKESAEGTLINQFSNANFTNIKRDEISAEINLRDSSGVPVEQLSADDITALLKWDNEGKMDSTEGTPRLIPINDRKKLAITFTMDYSGSMYGTKNYNRYTPKSQNIIQMEKSVASFIKKMNKQMYGRIIKFGSKVIPVCRFTNSKQDLKNALDSYSYPLGGTALYSSIMTALSDTMFSSNPTIMKTVIAFTDGMENSSKGVNLENIFKKCEETGTRIFTIGLFEVNGDYKPSLDELSKGKADLQLIASNSGGFYYTAENSSELGNIYDNIFKQVLNSFNISIVWNSSKLPPKGTQVTAELKINVKGIIRTIYKNYVID
ncbi:MAG: OmpA family protein [Ignavibacteria bacterium]|nr:OmpA family protein [Ignavibacteria bacterium]